MVISTSEFPRFSSENSAHVQVHPGAVVFTWNTSINSALLFLSFVPASIAGRMLCHWNTRLAKYFPPTSWRYVATSMFWKWTLFLKKWPLTSLKFNHYSTMHLLSLVSWLQKWPHFIAVYLYKIGNWRFWIIIFPPFPRFHTSQF